jgi:hypothetical protein
LLINLPQHGWTDSRMRLWQEGPSETTLIVPLNNYMGMTALLKAAQAQN